MEKNELHPIQKAFEDQASLQCGFCGPGVILSAKALLDRNPDPSKQEIRDALQEVAGVLRGESPDPAA